ncbi:hypothetical protein [Cellulomonas cellasea]|uniref:Uncharacterized protein n=1 Tax=Cellulomonas cellasea TaxID=43670 RepID=A0A7W4UCP3_9CELL|nr:hypothetical protein [Cellulomonas cellasea]MBB2921704.1 hypothetical protein [Cellulomonas cellasea]
MAGRTELAGSAWRTVTEQWPRVVQTWRLVDDFLRQHPELPAAARRTLEAGRARLAAAQQQRSPEARVRATLATVRRLADECVAQAPHDAALAEQVAAWRRGADRIDQALTLVAARRGLARRRMLARVVERTDALAGEAFDQLVADTGRQQPSPGAGTDVPSG